VDPSTAALSAVAANRARCGPCWLGRFLNKVDVVVGLIERAAVTLPDEDVVNALQR